jgi:biopolymer transport protein ExbB
MFRLDRLAGFLYLLLPSLPATAQSLNVANELAHGGIGIIVIGALSVLAVAVSFERLANFRLQKVAPAALADEAETLWRNGRFAELGERVAGADSPLARILGWMAAQHALPPDELAKRTAERARVELRLQQQKAYALNVVATVAPIVGLLGTVIGMIESFSAIASSGMGDPTLLAGGISKALVNTAAGLSVALPSLAMHHFFRNRMVYISIALDRQLSRLLDVHHGH